MEEQMNIFNFLNDQEEQNTQKTMVITRKFTLYPIGDKEEENRVYNYIRNGMEVQAIMMNQYMSALYSAKMKKASKEELKELRKLYSHVPDSKKGSAYDFDMEKYPTGLPLAGRIPRVCDKKFSKACKDGLMYGRVSLPTFKKTMPLMVHNDYVNIAGSKTRPSGRVIKTGIYHEYDTPMDLVDGLKNDKEPKVYIGFANDIKFKFVMNNVYQTAELRSVLQKAFEGEYKICDSSIGFDRSGKKIMLNLSLEIPIDREVRDENIVVGVDIGLAVPAVCALNNDLNKRQFIGSYDEFTRQRTQMQSQRRRITQAMKSNAGGHGRKKKLAHLDKLAIHEREFAKTYNHYISKRVVDFAVQNNAKYINMEKLTGFKNDEKHEFVLRNWSYYELQTMIEYKAKRRGIEVRYVDPAYTSQTCSVCGKMGTRVKQSMFVCHDPLCKCHDLYGEHFNADFNGARNIAMSVDFASDKKENKKEKKEKEVKAS